MQDLKNKKYFSLAQREYIKSPSKKLKASSMLLLLTAFLMLLSGYNAMAQPYTNIYNIGDLQNLANDVNSGASYAGLNVILYSNITGPMTIIIGDNGVAFNGNFDGQGYSIRLNITGSPGMPAGLFGTIKDGSIKNLTVSGRVIGDNRVGGIVGFLAGDNTDISNCTNQAEVTGTTDVGGIIGCIESGGRANVFNCTNSASVMGNSDNVGGIIGNNRCGRVMNCYNNGNVHGTNSSVGGIIGFNQCGDISACNNYGYISGYSIIGGIIGSIQSGNVTNCTNNDMISGYAETGGIIGEARISAITNCTNFDDVYGQYYTGGVVGVVSDGCIVRQCENSGDIRGIRNTGGIAGDFSGDMLYECTNIGFIIVDANGDGSGGIVGNNNRSINNCENGGAVQGGQSNTGGIAGINSGGIKNCINAAPIFSADISIPSIGAIVGTNNGNADNCYYDIQMYDGYYIGAGSGGGTYLNGLNTTAMLGTSLSGLLPSPPWIFDLNNIYPRLGNTDIDYLAAAPITLQIPEDADEILTSPFNVSILYGVNWGTMSVNNLVSISVAGVATFLPTANGKDTLIAGRNGIQKRVPIYIGHHTIPTVISITRSNPTYEKTNADEITFLVIITPPPVGYIPIFSFSQSGLIPSVINNPLGSGSFYVTMGTDGLGLNGSDIVSITGVVGYSMATTYPNESYDVRKVFWAFPTLKTPQTPADIIGNGEIEFKDYDGENSDLDQVVYQTTNSIGLNGILGYATIENYLNDNVLKFDYYDLAYSTPYDVSLAEAAIKDAWGNYNPEFPNSTTPIIDGSFTTKAPHSVTGIYRNDPIPEFDNKTNLDEVCFRVEFSEPIDLGIYINDIFIPNGSVLDVHSLNYPENTSWQVFVDVDDGDEKEGLIVQITNIDITGVDFTPDPNEDYNVRRTFMSISEVEVKVHYDDEVDGPIDGGPGYVKIIFNEPLNTDPFTGCKVKDYQSEDYYFYNLGQVGIGELHFDYCPPISSTTPAGFCIYFNILGYNELVDEWGNTGYLLPTYWVNEETAYKQSQQLASGWHSTPLLVGNVYPMPAVDNTNLDVSVYQEGNLQVSLYDLAGSKLFDVVNRYVDANTELNVSIPLGRLPNGMYNVVIQLGNERISKPIIISK